MTKIGIISDTHGFLDPKVKKHFVSVDEIWHAGDIGSENVLDELEAFKPTRAVYGNIDGQDIRIRTVEDLVFEIAGAKILMTHIGGYPPKYAWGIREKLKAVKPNLFVCGHSHILKVINDSKLNILHMNPGAAGKSGFHKVKTLLRFDISNGKFSNLEVIELGVRG